MAHRTAILLAASAVVSMAIAVAPTDALAASKKKKVAAVAAAPAVLVIPDSNIPADRVPRCIDSVIFYPIPPCY